MKVIALLGIEAMLDAIGSAVSALREMDGVEWLHVLAIVICLLPLVLPLVAGGA
jgi:hypothetical protein